MLNLRPFLRDYRQLAVVASLVFATVICAALLALRAAYSHAFGHSGLAWNLFLAWVPMLCSLVAYNLGKRARRWTWLLILPCAGAWLLFLPNAPYLITDLLHLRARDGVPLWYDLIMLVMFAWTGAFLGLVSLVLMQTLVRRSAGPRVGWLFVMMVIGLSGFGVYLGRFPRWNSWDVFSSPVELLAGAWDNLRHPIAHARTYAFSGLFSLLMASVYLMLVTLVRFLQPREMPEDS